MKVLFFILLLQNAFASNFEAMPCYKEFRPLLNEWKPTNEWSKQFQGGLESFFWTSPTATIGEWVLVKDVEEGTVVGKVSQGGRIEAFFAKGSCQKTVKTYPHSAPVKGFKNDKDIASFVTKNKKGVIYVWSPRMGLSKEGIKEIKKASSELKLPVLVLLDKEIKGPELAGLRKELGNDVTTQVDSLEFNMRNVNQHFPAMMVFKDERILPGIKYGYEKSDRYRSDVIDMLGDR